MSGFRGFTTAAIAVVALTGVARAQEATVPVPAATPAAAPVAEKMICKSQLETGSLVKKRKICLTRKQWLYVNDSSSDSARRMVEDNAGRPSSN